MRSLLLRRGLLPALLAAALTASAPALLAPAAADETASPSPSATASPSPEPSPSSTSEPSASPSATPKDEPRDDEASPSPSAEPAEKPAPEGERDDAEGAEAPMAFSSLAVTAAAAPADPAVVDAAGAWLAGQLSAAGTVVGSYPGADGEPVEFTDWGRTLDSALALLAAGGHDELLGRTLNSVEDPDAVAAYTQGAPFDQADAAYVGATAKLAFVVVLTGGDATDVGGVDLLAQLTSLAQPDGRFADRSLYGSFANLYGHAFALLALETAGASPTAAAVQALLDAQCPDGSFPEGYPDGTCTGQIDATGLVLQALAAVGLAGSAAAQDAAAWLTAQQRGDGSFPGEAPVNSTGYAVLGLNAVDAPTGDAVGWLSDQQNPDGGLWRGTGDDSGSDLFATAQALPALAGTTFAASGRPITRSTQQPTPTPSTSSPAPTVEPGAPVAPAPTAAVLGASGDRGAAAVVRADSLPRTGGELRGVLAGAVVLLVAGAALTASTRRPRRGRHA